MSYEPNIEEFFHQQNISYEPNMLLDVSGQSTKVSAKASNHNNLIDLNSRYNIYNAILESSYICMNISCT